MLTPRQKECLDFIRAYQNEHGGQSPTFPEIGEGMGLSSKSGVHRLVHGLEHRGFLRLTFIGTGEPLTMSVLQHAEFMAVFEPARVPIYDAQTFQLRGYVS